MPAILTAYDISKSYGYHTVLNDVSLILNPGERIGLVGANGVGKTTLLKIIVGSERADTGTTTLAPGCKLGYLAQVIERAAHHTFGDLIDEAVYELRALETTLRSLEADMTSASGDALAAIMAAYGDASERFERLGVYDLDHRIAEILTGLGLAHFDRARPFDSFSGGERAIGALALLLLQSPDALLLDEPTNHLDFARLAWLEDYLRQYRGAALIVSHDRHFLNRAVNAIVEIDDHSRQTKRYAGNYDSYAAAKARERRQWQQDYARQQDEIRALQLEAKQTARRNDNYRAHTDGDKFVRNFKIAQHDATVARRIHLAEEKLARILADPLPRPPRPLAFDYDFHPEALQGRTPLSASGLVKAYAGRRIVDSVSFALAPDSRVILVGPNGAGKSTLLRLLVGAENPDAGEVRRHPAVRIGYLMQEKTAFDPQQPAFDAYLNGLEGTERQLKARLLEMGLFRYDELEKRVGELSAGQQRKLQIAHLIAEQANLLILDEPTNHASFDVVEGLEAALASFQGPVIAATHDRRFMRELACGSRPAEIWALANGHIIRYPGGWGEYAAALHTHP